jgi:hypothetical protein
MAPDKDQDMKHSLPVCSPILLAQRRMTRRLRAASVRRIWNQSKALASTFSNDDITFMQQSWFLDRFGVEEKSHHRSTKGEKYFDKQSDGGLPERQKQPEIREQTGKISGQKITRYQNQYMQNILWLIEVRAGFQSYWDNKNILKVNAALWRNVIALKETQKQLRQIAEKRAGLETLYLLNLQKTKDVQHLKRNRAHEKLGNYVQEDKYYDYADDDSTKLVEQTAPKHQNGYIGKRNRSICGRRALDCHS